MAKRQTTLEPVTEREVGQAVLRTIGTAFGNRPLDVDTARWGLANAAFTLIELHLREVDKGKSGES